jgi:hypothetical protein
VASACGGGLDRACLPCSCRGRQLGSRPLMWAPPDLPASFRLRGCATATVLPIAPAADFRSYSVGPESPSLHLPRGFWARCGARDPPTVDAGAPTLRPHAGTDEGVERALALC